VWNSSIPRRPVLKYQRSHVEVGPTAGLKLFLIVVHVTGSQMSLAGAVCSPGLGVLRVMAIFSTVTIVFDLDFPAVQEQQV